LSRYGRGTAIQPIAKQPTGEGRGRPNSSAVIGDFPRDWSTDALGAIAAHSGTTPGRPARNECRAGQLKRPKPAAIFRLLHTKQHEP
jgi:hypothetical protein